MADAEPEDKRRAWLERKKAKWAASTRRSESPQLASRYLGIAAYFREPPGSPGDRSDALAGLLVDQRWPWAPWWVSYTGVEKQDDRSAVRLSAKTAASTIARGLREPTVRTLYLKRTERDQELLNVRLDLLPPGDARHALRLWVTCRAEHLPPGASAAVVVSLVHDLVAALGARHACIGVWSTYRQAIGDTWLTQTILDTPAGSVNLGLPSDYDEQIHLTAKWGYALGDRYARHPRWGTYLHPGHLTAIGGIERIRAEVAPAVIEPVGDLTYVQLTDSIDTAMTADAETKRRAPQALMAPILVGAPGRAEVP